jgi:hypothetical protein
LEATLEELMLDLAGDGVKPNVGRCLYIFSCCGHERPKAHREFSVAMPLVFAFCDWCAAISRGHVFHDSNLWLRHGFHYTAEREMTLTFLGISLSTVVAAAIGVLVTA